MRSTKPIYQSVIDLGLRDVGVRNNPRRLAGFVGKASLATFAFACLSAIAVCAVIGLTGGGAWLILPLIVLWSVGLFVTAIRGVNRSAPVAVRVNAQGKNQASWLGLAHCLLLAMAAALIGELWVLPLVIVSGVMAVLMWRVRKRLPDALRELRALLASGETVLGDGIGLAGVGSGRRERSRLVVATDRRLVVTRWSSSAGASVVLDVPYRDVSRYAIEWKSFGRAGQLSVTAPGEDGVIQEHVVGSIVPLNLLSIARALDAHGVPADDPDALAEAERAWEEVQQVPPPAPLLDRGAMRTRAFDRGLWLLLVVSVALFYFVNVGLWLVPIVGAVCLVCGYASRTRSSLAYLVPLNLLIAPTVFFVNSGYVILLMALLSAVGALGLWVGSKLRRGAPAVPEERTGLRGAVSGASLVRISGALLTAVLAVVIVGALVGVEPRTLGLAIEQATATELPADGRSNLTGNDASVTYTPGPGLHEYLKDEHWDAGPNDGARWELRTSVTDGDNVVSLAHYIFEPALDSPAAVAKFVADKDDEHSRYARHRVGHTRRVVDGRTGYVWTHTSGGGYWHHVVWFPAPVHSIRLECIANREVSRFKRLCDEALRSLRFH
jgi:hypothetical protein